MNEGVNFVRLGQWFLARAKGVVGRRGLASPYFLQEMVYYDSFYSLFIQSSFWRPLNYWSLRLTLLFQDYTPRLFEDSEINGQLN